MFLPHPVAEESKTVLAITAFYYHINKSQPQREVSIVFVRKPDY